MPTIQESAKLSALVYEPTIALWQLPSGWEVAKTQAGTAVELSASSGYYGVVFVKPSTGEYVLASRGSNEVVDWIPSNALMGGGYPPTRMDAALALLNDATRLHGVPLENLSFTGHSLGGTISQLLTVMSGRESITFNAYPAKRLVSRVGGDPNAEYPITDVVYSADIVSKLGPPLGHRIVISGPNPYEPFPVWGLTSFGAAANIERILWLYRTGRAVFASHEIDRIVGRLRSAASLPCPLALDLDGDGVETMSVGIGPYFDHDADGFAERTGWIGANDGLLVRDLDGDGVIESGRELFGNHTRLPSGTDATSGYAALAALDANGDGRVDASDPAFASLRVWRDANGDGRSETAELQTLPAAGVQSVGVASTQSALVDPAGNVHQLTGTFTRGGGGTGATADVWFRSDRVDSLAVEWVEIPAALAALPDAMGFGQVRDLLQAAARDGVLEGLVRDFAAEPDPARRSALLDGLIFRWAGVDGIAPDSRGGLIDARKLTTLERFAAEPFAGPRANPAQPAATELTVAYRELAELVYAELMQTTRLADLYGLITYSWDEAASTVRGDLSAVVAELNARIAADPAAGTTALAEFARTLRGFGAEAIHDFAAFHDYFVGRGGDVAWAVETAGRLIVDGTSAADTLTGGPGELAIRGRAGADTITGGAAADVLWGDEGADRLSGGAGDDVLDGGPGNDVMDAGAGNDIYVFGRGAGQDTVNDYDWQLPNTDRVRLAPDVAPADVAVRRAGNALVLRIAATGDEMSLTDWFLEGFGSAFQVQEVAFADGTVWDVATLRLKALDGTEGPDQILGTSAAETLSGHGGNDQLDGGGGNDVLRAGAGDDALQGGAGDDLLDGGPGNDALDGGFGSDTYLLGRGSGQDTVNDRDWQVPSLDRVLLAADVTPADVAVRRVGNSLVVAINGTTDSLSITDWFLEGFGADYQVQRVEFADGTSWDVEALKARVLAATEGPDLLIGYGSAETIDALGGNDQVFGLGGADTLDGGAGNDLLDGGAGNDLLRGGAGADDLRGGDHDDVLDGGPGNDALDGGFGSDTYLFGRGSGLDTVNDRDWQLPSLDRVLLAADVTPADVTVRRVGNSLVLAINGTTDSLSITDWFLEGFGADYQVQRVQFADGTAWDVPMLKQFASAIVGTAGADTLTGTAASETIRGLGGNDQLFGRGGDDLLDGGAGADGLTGEGGNDTYVVDDAADVVTESPGQGTDTVQASISYALAAEVERLVLIGTAPINGTGNGLANTLTGNAAANVLDGAAGADTLTGGAGDDTYVLDEAGDTVVELAGEGIDTVQSRVSVTLAANVERLLLLGTSPISGTGNALDNVLTGNAAANVLAGGAGNDTYVIDGSGDTVTEAAGAGIDEVLSSVAYTLPANVENLALTGAASSATGNALANVLSGNASNNTLAGGAGNDTYRFGRGGKQDTVVETDTTPGNTDTVLFESGLAPLDLVLGRSGKDLRLAVHGSADAVIVRDWYKGSTAPVEIFQAANGQRLLAAEVARLVQDMAGFTAQTGLSWDQAIDQRPADVQAILAAHWQPA